MKCLYNVCIKVLFLILFVPLLYSCATEESIPGSITHTSTYELTLGVPSFPTTYTAVDPKLENKIEHIGVIVFRKIGAGEYIYYYYKEGIEIKDVLISGSKKTFEVRLKWIEAAGEEHLLVIIANAEQEVKDKVSSFIIGGTTKKEALEQILFETNGKWATTSGVKPMPMWGEIEGVQIEEDTPPKSLSTVKLLRAMARVDVGINYSGSVAQGLGKSFLLDEVYVVNTNKKGHVVPLASAGFNGVKVSSPSIPTESAIDKTFLKSINTTTDKFEISGGVYVNESKAPTGVITEEIRVGVTGLVIGGRYSDNPLVEGSEKTYYRVDIKTPLGDFKDVLRNNFYRVNIKSVSDQGESSVEKAWSAREVPMDVEILGWEIANMDEVVDGMNVLRSTSSADVKVTGATGQQLEIFTNCFGGWKVEAVDPTKTWLRVTSSPKGAENVEGSITFNADPNTSAIVRYFDLRISAGRMSMVTRISQKSALTVNIPNWTNPGVNESETRHYYLDIDKTLVQYPKPIPEGYVLSSHNTLKLFMFSTDYPAGFVGYHQPNSAAPVTVTIKNEDPTKAEWVRPYAIQFDNYYLGETGLTRYAYDRMYVGLQYFPPKDYLPSETPVAYMTVKLGNLSRQIRIEQSIDRLVIRKGKHISPGHDLTIEKSMMITSGEQFYDVSTNWYAYMNVPDGYNGSYPDGAQVTPARKGSCAELNEQSYLGYTNWRVPTVNQWSQFRTYMQINGGVGNPVYGIGADYYVTSNTVFESPASYYVIYASSSSTSTRVKSTAYSKLRCFRYATELD